MKELPAMTKKQKNQQRHINALMPFTTAPLFHALQLLAVGDSTRYHMPGHKGQPIFETFSPVFAIDFTETYGTGNLYLGDGPIRDAEIACARYYRADDCFFLTGGSTQGNLAMLATAVGMGGAVLLDRACHKSVCHACALLDITPYFISGDMVEGDTITGTIAPQAIEDALVAHPEIRAVFLTSPTYYGVCQELDRIAPVCHRHGARLLVDAAHGAHLRSLGIQTPIECGADIAVLSMHKTLPCLGQGAVLLMRRDVDRKQLRENTALFGTSSPSYPIMASIDLARAYMEEIGHAKYQKAAESCIALRAFINQHTIFSALHDEQFPELDPCRLTLSTAGTALTGNAMSDQLWENFGVACEMADATHVVFIFTGNDAIMDLMRLKSAIKKLSQAQRDAAPLPAPTLSAMPEATRVMPVREAWFARRHSVPIALAEGKICARPVTPYPPGIPLLWPGEKITRNQIEFLQQKCYNVEDEVEVVDVREAERGFAL